MIHQVIENGKMCTINYSQTVINKSYRFFLRLANKFMIGIPKIEL